MDSNTITVLVGSQHSKFRVHEAVLVHHSDYFRKALPHTGLKQEQRTIIVSDLDAQAFAVFVTWMYTACLPATENDWPTCTHQDDPSSNVFRRHQKLIRYKTYVLADRLGSNQFLKAVNNYIIDGDIGEAPWYDCVIYAFENIPADRPILKMMVDSHCADSFTEDDEIESERRLLAELPHTFLIRIMQCYRQMREDKVYDPDLNACDYHEHGSEVERVECKRKIEEELE